MPIFFDPKWKETIRLPESAFQALSVRLAEKRTDLIEKWKRPERLHHRYAPLYLPFETEAVENIDRLISALGSPRVVILVGIGGSSLGVEAVAHALGLAHKLVVLDTLDPSRISQLEIRLAQDRIHSGDIVLIIVSKNGMTTETLANTAAVQVVLESKYGDMRDHTVAISDEGTPLEREAREHGWHFYTIPKSVGGRFSIFSHASLIPLALLGVNIREFLSGGRDILERGWKTPLLKDPASLLASIAYLYHEKHIHTAVNFFFDPALEALGKWYRQLCAESSGKQKGAHRVGILPHIAIGTTDLHSIEQYLVSGPRDFFVAITRIKPSVEQDRIPVLYGKTLLELRDTIVRGLELSYRGEGVPFCTIELDQLTSRTLGGYMAMRMEEVILLCGLLDVDPFTQPGVESYKTHTRALLGRGSA